MNNYRLIGTVVELINEEDKIAIKLEVIGQSSNGKNRALLEVFPSEQMLITLEKEGIAHGAIIGVDGYFKSYIDFDKILRPCLEVDKIVIISRNNERKVIS